MLSVTLNNVDIYFSVFHLRHCQIIHAVYKQLPQAEPLVPQVEPPLPEVRDRCK